jgi:hypothetical protein
MSITYGQLLADVTNSTVVTAASATFTMQQIATAAVSASAGTAGVNSFNTRSGNVTLQSSDVTGALSYTPVSSSAVSGLAPVNSPDFSGTPTAPTAASGTNNTQLATTAFVQTAVSNVVSSGGLAGVSSFNSRAGAVSLLSSDVTGALTYVPAPSAAVAANTTAITNNTANISANSSAIVTLTNSASAYVSANSPAFSGTPTAPTAASGTNNTQLATTAFVKSAVVSSVSGVASFNSRTGAVALSNSDVTSALTFTPSPSGFVTPQQFGAVGNGLSNPASGAFSTLSALQAVYSFATSLSQELDYLGWQAAINSGLPIVSLALHYVMCNSSSGGQNYITIQSGKNIQGNNCIWDFGSLQAQTQNFPTVLNCAVYMTKDGLSYTSPHILPISGLKINGPGKTSSVIGVMWNQFTNYNGTSNSLDNSVVNGFGTGLYYGNGAYLVNNTNLSSTNCTLGISFPSGSIDSGENNIFVGGAIGGNTTALDNSGGSEFTFYGTSMDYVGQTVIDNNSGRIELHGVHCETNVPTSSGAPLFHCINTGRIAMYGGMFLGAGGIKTAPTPPIWLDTTGSIFEFFGTQIYNLSSLTTAVQGPGCLRAYGWINTGNPNISTPSSAYGMDAFGGTGTFEVAAGPFKGIDPTGISIPGGIYVTGVTNTDRWNSANITTAINSASAYVYAGTKSLSITKINAANTTDDQIVFVIPCQPGQNAWFSMQALFPNASGAGTGTAPIYFRTYWTNTIGYDSLGRPIFSGQTAFTSENDINVPLAGSTTWISRSLSTTVVTPGTSLTTPFCGSACPLWANGFSILMDTQSIPATTFYLDSITANVL